MKKAISLVVAIILTVISVSCTYQGEDNKKSLNSKEVSKSTATVSLSSSSNVKFEYFFRGFVTLVGNDKISNYPRDPWIIETDADWHDFMDKYVPGARYLVSVDYSKESLIFSPFFPAQAPYSYGTDIKTFTVEDKEFIPKYIKHENGTINDICVQNIDDILHVFVNIVKVNKKDIPTDISNKYHKD
ncbi:hypothetical protein [Ruminiclostridium papyrosolvens]|uniref:Lipoprotein n=1 Tax=Ruminiclostridium papyrosolvens C7 TaxID=1330534 RepID=U4QX13_9FIRM|nr:hypothetical protein [Ruminiclostridium papyrosolvens]EPR08111.1 hypothetical protein L323_18435 [Ruminiclostridium papyrosolvens C7]